MQLQSVSLVESSSIPNNQIESVTENSATSDYTYDAAGNVTDDDVNTFVYDAENRLVSVNSGAEQYKYDHQNRRVAKTVGSVTTQYIWEGSKAVAEHAASTGNALVDYVFVGGRMVKKVEGSTTRYIVSDRLSARMMLDEDYDVVGKQSHLPFGEAMATSGEQDKHHFTSYERDSSTGLDYAVNRWHSSGVGRFLQVDPYRASASIQSPQSLNRYVYVGDDPINRYDPLGLFCVITGYHYEYRNIGGVFTIVATAIEECYLDGRPIGPTTGGDNGLPAPVTPGEGQGGSGGILDIEELARVLLLQAAISDAINAINRRRSCRELFAGWVDPISILREFQGGSVRGAFHFRELLDDQGNIRSTVSAETIPRFNRVQGPSGPVISGTNGADITINLSGPFFTGYSRRYGVRDRINRAITILHELGHALDYTYNNENTSAIETNHEGEPGYATSAENSQLIFNNCFR